MRRLYISGCHIGNPCDRFYNLQISIMHKEVRKNMELPEERIAVLKDREAKDFLEYMSKPLSNEEKQSLKAAYDFYK